MSETTNTQREWIQEMAVFLVDQVFKNPGTMLPWFYNHPEYRAKVESAFAEGRLIVRAPWYRPEAWSEPFSKKTYLKLNWKDWCYRSAELAGGAAEGVDRAANHAELQRLTRQERFALLYGQPQPQKECDAEPLYRIKPLVFEKIAKSETWIARGAIPNKSAYIVSLHQGEWKCRKRGGGKFWPCHTKEEGIARMQDAYRAFISQALEEVRP
jgi:hypothetical protein